MTEPSEPAHPSGPTAAPTQPPIAAPQRINLAFMLQHPAHLIALGFGSGLSPRAPGTAGSLLGWGSYALISLWAPPEVWAGILLGSAALGWWACTVAAGNARSADPGSIVWDEILGFWCVLWLLGPATLWQQLLAFALFRYFDAAKPGPVGWADQAFKGGGWLGGFGILFDDLVAALCTLLSIAAMILIWPELRW